jgi:hypothetical protein
MVAVSFPRLLVALELPPFRRRARGPVSSRAPRPAAGRVDHGQPRLGRCIRMSDGTTSAAMASGSGIVAIRPALLTRVRYSRRRIVLPGPPASFLSARSVRFVDGVDEDRLESGQANEAGAAPAATSDGRARRASHRGRGRSAVSPVTRIERTRQSGGRPAGARRSPRPHAPRSRLMAASSPASARPQTARSCRWLLGVLHDVGRRGSSAASRLGDQLAKEAGCRVEPESGSSGISLRIVEHGAASWIFCCIPEGTDLLLRPVGGSTFGLLDTAARPCRAVQLSQEEGCSSTVIFR